MQVSPLFLVLSLTLVLPQGFCTAVKGWKVLKNDATEILPEFTGNGRIPQEAMLLKNTTNGNSVNNRAKTGGRRPNAVSYSASEMSCRELHSTRYITDGSCRSAKPVKELVCSGQCMPVQLVPNVIGRRKWWRSSASEYRCISAHSRTRRVQLLCPNGNIRTYKIRMVTSCKCKRFRPYHNQSVAKEVPAAKRNKKHSQAQDRNNNNKPLTGNSY